MNQNRLTTLIATVFLLVISVNTMARQASMRDGMHERHRGHERMGMNFSVDPARMLAKMERHLELDEEQSLAISNILDAARPEADSLHERTSKNRAALSALDPENADYHTSLQNLSALSGSLAAEGALLHGRVRVEIYAVLLPEQRQKLAQRAGHKGHRQTQKDRETDK